MIFCQAFFAVHYLNERVFLACFVHGNAGDECQGMIFIFGDQFEIPAFKVFSPAAPALVLVGVPEGAEFVVEHGSVEFDGFEGFEGFEGFKGWTSDIVFLFSPGLMYGSVP